ncbi:hypothetical protein LOC68_16215 [Blastopirellula sp. JC732]|uniref:Uncharacterized protein n=1 Tax=Blastopirellula sediminis TaxID=2894196 RepID=A0A9X1SHA2_9BACT|nr:hypothetical protein [Blastopirellula sediminis]MCC9606766.1 hypothetical protein [Blastopirellula sediminis]MCC9629937.1 hypothetical protein [Blastopirellula sediminis]
MRTFLTLGLFVVLVGNVAGGQPQVKSWSDLVPSRPSSFLLPEQRVQAFVDGFYPASSQSQRSALVVGPTEAVIDWQTVTPCGLFMEVEEEEKLGLSEVSTELIITVKPRIIISPEEEEVLGFGDLGE